MHKIFT